jgi:uncharacterized membrane protein
MNRKTIYWPHSTLLFAVLLTTLLIATVFVGLIGAAFSDIGFNPVTVILILFATFIGSTINIPLYKTKTCTPTIQETETSYYGVTYRIPQTTCQETATQIAINLGGALIPTVASIYLLSQANLQTATFCLIDTAVVTLVCKAIARPVKGVGIIMPGLIAPIIAALTAMLLSTTHATIIAYTAGTLGTLIGADLLNLKKISRLGAPVASIGGAGTFDGVFLSGIFAVILAGI